jgi:hypothetical protein
MVVFRFVSEWYAETPRVWLFTFRHIRRTRLLCPTHFFPPHHFRLSNVLLCYFPHPSQLRQCGRSADSHGLSNSHHDWRLKVDNTPNIIWNNLELPLDDSHLCVDCRAPKRTAAKSVESALESAEDNVLDGHRARAGISMGGQTILCCEGDTGRIQ